MATLQRVLGVALKVMAALVALVVALYLVVNLAGLASAHSKRNALGDQLTDRIAEVLPTSQERIGTVVQLIDVAPDHTWVAQRCDFDTHDSGWMVNNYREVCALESVHAWRVDSEEQARSLLGTLGQAAGKPSGSNACVRFDVSSRLGEQDPFADSRIEVNFAVPGEPDSRWCLPTLEGYQSRRGVVGAVPGLDAWRGWLVVVQTDELIDENIGCTHWSVIFCDNPFGDELAWGEPPF